MDLPAKPANLPNIEFVRGLTPYVFASRIVRDKSVLDVGCGTGHGTWLLAASGSKRVGAVDLDEERAHHASELCSDFPDFDASAMDAQRLDFQDQSFQVITCFEVIEHLPSPAMLLAGLKRILAPDGVAMLTTPNRLIRLLPLQRPWNPEHLREYTAGGFRRVLTDHFPSVTLLAIGAEPQPYAYYRNLWRQSPLRVYLAWLRRPARAVLRAAGRKPAGPAPSGSGNHLSNMAVPPLNPEDWPFYVDRMSDDCLNFFALCGFDDGAVQAAAREIIGSREAREVSEP